MEGRLVSKHKKLKYNGFDGFSVQLTINASVLLERMIWHLKG